MNNITNVKYVGTKGPDKIILDEFSNKFDKK